MKAKRILVSIIISVLALSAALLGAALNADASAVDKLTIKIGYYGWDSDEYVVKAVFKASDLYDMGTVKEDYTYYDGNKKVAIDSSIGVPLSTVLDAAGIDQGSIANLDFWTADMGSGAFTSFTWKQLIGTKRYYFRDLPSYFSYDDSGKVVCDTDEAWKHAKRVKPMMALEENWTWYEIGTEDAAGTDNFGTANRFRLNFGQTDPMEKRTFNSAKMVHTIYVMFSGTPSLTSGESNINGKVGSHRKLKVTAAAADEALLGVVQGDVMWSSSDTSVVEVDDDGELTFVGEGTAVVTAYSEGASYSFRIRVGGEEEEAEPEPEPEPEPEEKPEDKKPVSGSGDGNGGNGNGDGKSPEPAGTDTDTPGVNTKNTASVKTEKVDPGPKTFVLSDSASRRLRSAFSRTASAEEASMNIHQEEMDKDTEQLQIKKEDNKLMGVMGLINGILVIEGGIFGFFRYRKQRWG